MTHPLTLLHALKDAGMTCRTSNGKLLVNPVAGLQGDLRERVISQRAAMVAWLEGAADDDARAEAIAQDAAEWNPFDRPDVPPPVLVRLHKDGEPPRYAAVDPGWLDDFTAWAEEARRMNARATQKKQKKARKKR